MLDAFLGSGHPLVSDIFNHYLGVSSFRGTSAPLPTRHHMAEFLVVCNPENDTTSLKGALVGSVRLSSPTHGGVLAFKPSLDRCLGGVRTVPREERG